MSSCDPKVKEVREEKDIPTDTLMAIRTVTANMETLPVGTFKYKLFKYPGDIDLFEVLDSCCTLNVAKTNAAQKIQKIVADVVQSKNIIFVEFKAGYDNRYNIYTGTFDDKENYVDYQASYVRRDIVNLYETGLLTQDKAMEMIKLAADDASLENILQLNEMLRNYRVVRWKSSDVLNGYKMLPGNYKLFLDIALTQGSIVKLDTISYVNNRYIEMTNFLLISQTDKYGHKKILSEELGDYQQSLLSDVHKYYEKNTLKAIKRYWMYLAYKDLYCDLSIYRYLFDSELALYSQVSADIEVAIILLNSDLPYDKELLFSSLTERLKLLDRKCIESGNYKDVESKDYKVIAENLAILKSCIDSYINTETKLWLKENNIEIPH